MGSLLEALPDDVVTIAMSDHGARPMMGGLCFNDWLMDEGYLVMKEPLKGVTPIAKAPIDWSRTTAWGDGGYYGRLFLNIKGREPGGIVEPAEYETIRNEMIAKLEALPGPDGRPMGTEGAQAAGRLSGGPRRRPRPHRLLRRPRLALGGGRRQRRASTPTRTTPAPTAPTTTGGAFFSMMNLPGQPMGKVDGMNLVDVGPSILSLYDIEAPAGAVGRSFLQ